MAGLALFGIEAAVDETEKLLRERFNPMLLRVWTEHRGPAGLQEINLQKVEPHAFYTSDVVEPMALPAIFVVADRTVHAMRALNFDLQEHILLVGLLCEGKEYNELNRKVWRYAESLQRCLHDAGTPTCRLLVEETSYSPTFGSITRNERNFRKDVTKRVRAMQYGRHA